MAGLRQISEPRPEFKHGLCGAGNLCKTEQLFTWHEIKLILAYVARPRGRTMLWLILAILAILWMLGSNINFAGGLVHLLLISALILMVLRLLRGRHRIW